MQEEQEMLKKNPYYMMEIAWFATSYQSSSDEEDVARTQNILGRKINQSFNSFIICRGKKIHLCSKYYSFSWYCLKRKLVSAGFSLKEKSFFNTKLIKKQKNSNKDQ